MSEEGALLRQACDALREIDTPSAAELDATRDALRRRVRAGEVGPPLPERRGDCADETGPPVPRHRRSRPLVVGAVVALAAAAAAFAWLPTVKRLVFVDEGANPSAAEFDVTQERTGSATVPRRRDAAAPRPPRHDAPDPTVTPAPPAEPAPPEATQPTRRRTSPREKSKPSRVPKNPTVAPAAPKPSPAMAEQAVMLQDVRRVVARHPARALELLAQHRALFPQTTFKRERDALMLVARCNLGEAQAVRGQAQAFVRRHDSSPVAQRIREACDVVDHRDTRASDRD